MVWYCWGIQHYLQIRQLYSYDTVMNSRRLCRTFLMVMKPFCINELSHNTRASNLTENIFICGSWSLKPHSSYISNGIEYNYILLMHLLACHWTLLQHTKFSLSSTCLWPLLVFKPLIFWGTWLLVFRPAFVSLHNKNSIVISSKLLPHASILQDYSALQDNLRYCFIMTLIGIWITSIQPAIVSEPKICMSITHKTF